MSGRADFYLKKNFATEITENTEINKRYAGMQVYRYKGQPGGIGNFTGERERKTCERENVRKCERKRGFCGINKTEIVVCKMRIMGYNLGRKVKVLRRY
jgi:hypothetical protein